MPLRVLLVKTPDGKNVAETFLTSVRNRSLSATKNPSRRRVKLHACASSSEYAPPQGERIESEFNEKRLA